MLKIIFTIILVAHLTYAAQICVDDPNNFCNATLSVNTDKEIYNNKEKILIHNNLSIKGNFILEYWIENSNGTIIKNKVNTTNLNEKTFTPNLVRTEKLKIKNKLISIDCNNTNSIRESEREIEVFVYKSELPFLEIIKVDIGTDKKIYLNESIKLKVNVYTGNYTGELNLNLINITNETYPLPNTYSEYNLSTDITIPLNCNIQTNNYTLRTSAINLTEERQILVINNCKSNPNNNTGELNITIGENLFFESESNINSSENAITGRIIYESPEIKAKGISSYILIAIVIMAFLYIIPKISKNGISHKSNNGSHRVSRRTRKQSSY